MLKQRKELFINLGELLNTEKTFHIERNVSSSTIMIENPQHLSICTRLWFVKKWKSVTVKLSGCSRNKMMTSPRCLGSNQMWKIPNDVKLCFCSTTHKILKLEFEVKDTQSDTEIGAEVISKNKNVYHFDIVYLDNYNGLIKFPKYTIQCYSKSNKYVSELHIPEGYSLFLSFLEYQREDIQPEEKGGLE